MVLMESVTNVVSRVGHHKVEKGIKGNNSSNSNINNDVHRPTEAQLRWAQFHHKARAREVKERVERLWNTPLEVKDVDGALSDDELSTCSDGSFDSKENTLVQRKVRPKISRGRRALLKVSKRGYEKRKALVRQQGFQRSSDKENLVNDERDEREGPKRNASRSRGVTISDDARKHRFAAAYAMMNNLNSSQQPIVVRSTKRWTRPNNVRSTTESGTNYQDWKWGLARRKRTADSQLLSRIANLPFDRRASWLVHMPAKEVSSASRRYKYRQPVASDGTILEPVALYDGSDLSPGQLKFDEMVSRLQDYDSAELSSHDIANVSARYLNSLPASVPTESPRVVRKQRTLFDSTLAISSEQDVPKLVRQSRESIGLKLTREQLHPHEEPLPVVRRSRSSIVDRYEAYLTHQRGRVSEAHTVGSIGSVNSDFFEKARNMHDTTPLDNGSGNRHDSMHSFGLKAISESDNTHGDVQSTRKKCNSLMYSTSRVHDGNFHLDHTRLVDGQLKAGAGPDDCSDRLDLQKRHVSPAGLFDIHVCHDSYSGTGEDASDLQTPRSQIRDKGALFDLTTPSSEQSDHAPLSTTSSFRLGAAKVAGGLFQMMTGKGHSSSIDDENELRALAAFREKQSERRGKQEGSTSTSSSFHMLPEGLRRIVLGNNSIEQDAKLKPSSEMSHKSEVRGSVQTPQPSGGSSDPPTPQRLLESRSVANTVSPEHGKLVHQKLKEESPLLSENGRGQAIIDTDDTNSETSGYAMDALTAANLMMSPTILTKRHQQAVKAIERRNWEQILYLLSANPWLAEMMEVTTQQYLLHKVALYGASKFLWSDENDAVDVVQAAPQLLNDDILRRFPSAVHKFDHDGNLPLHMAAASGNIEMSILLGESFPSGASVRNNDGMLPLHLAVQACSTPLANAAGDMVYGADFVALILELFPGAVAVADGEGDLPIHIAAAVLEGEVGVDIIYLLLDEADRQAQSDGGLRFIEKVQSKTDDDSIDVINEGEEVHCIMVKNLNGRNALTKAIEAGSGWQVIEGLARGPGGVSAALMQDADKCNALHLLLSEEYGDPQAALSILKIAPATVTVRNSDRMLPVEIACRNGMPEEVILAIVIVDSPVDLSRKDAVKIKDGFGGSWWFLTCESDDQFVDLVIEVISICNHGHLRELCCMKGGQNGNGAPVLARATPLCRQILEEALTFGRTDDRFESR